jgi:hypothetical protein
MLIIAVYTTTNDCLKAIQKKNTGTFKNKKDRMTLRNCFFRIAPNVFSIKTVFSDISQPL